jgi:hypothetical protein
MPWKTNHTAAASGISAKEYADAVKDSVRTGGGSQRQARDAAGKAHGSAVRGGASKK